MWQLPTLLRSNIVNLLTLIYQCLYKHVVTSVIMGLLLIIWIYDLRN